MPISVTDELKLSYLAWLAAEDDSAAKWVRTLRDYAVGTHPTYLTDRQKEFIGLQSRDANHLFQHNLCALVIGAVVERLAVTGFQPVKIKDAQGNETPDAASQALADVAAEWWESSRMDATQDELYEAACRDEEAYLIVDWDIANSVPRWTLNERFDGTQGIKLHRHPDTDELQFASKRWQTYDPTKPGATGKTRLTLYFPDRVEKYIQSSNPDAAFAQAGWDKVTDAPGEPWPIPWVDGDGEPLGLAVVPFANPGGSEIADLIPIQDMLNKSDLDLIAAADSAGFRILWASGVGADMDSATGEERKVTISPGRLIRMASENARLGAIDPIGLETLINGSKYWIESAAGITRTPQYLFQAHGADQPSGESLKMQEVGLVAKVGRKQKVFGNAWEDVIYLSAKLAAVNGVAVPDARLQTAWQDAETRNEREQAEIAEIERRLGIPLETVLEQRFGMNRQEIEQVMELVQAEKEREASLTEALMRNMDRGQAGA